MGSARRSLTGAFRGVVFNKGCNWEFDRDIDLWIAQPGVMVLDDGHVASISLGGFGARGHMPEELGELSELRSLILGSHNDAINSSPINKIDDPDELIAAQRADFKQMTFGLQSGRNGSRNVECPA